MFQNRTFDLACIMTSGKEKKFDRKLSSSRYLLITFLISQRPSAKYIYKRENARYDFVASKDSKHI